MILGKETVNEVTDSKGDTKKNVSFEQVQSKNFMFIQRLMFRFFSRSLTLIAGISLTRKKQNVSDFFSDYVKYEEMQKDKVAPIIICNHSTPVDYLFFLSIERPASFLANSDMKNMPIYGMLSQTMQGLYVDRTNNNSKTQALEDIRIRAKDIEAGKDLPQILIFPEGVVNCTEELMNFKPGAFESFSLLKIYGMKVESDVQKLPSWSLISTLEILTYLLSETQFPLTMYEFDNFDPMYTLNRHGITKDHPDAINLIIKDVRHLMEYGCGLRTKANTTGTQKNEQEHLLVKIPNGISIKPPKFESRRNIDTKTD